jgi:hypothetical protein
VGVEGLSVDRNQHDLDLACSLLHAAERALEFVPSDGYLRAIAETIAHLRKQIAGIDHHGDSIPSAPVLCDSRDNLLDFRESVAYLATHNTATNDHAT